MRHRGARRAPPRRWVHLTALVSALLLLALDGAVLVARRPAGPAPVAPAPTSAADPQVLRVARLVAELRGLTFEQVPEPTALPPASLAERAAALLDDYRPEDAAADRRILVTLGMLPADTDLRALLREALAGGVGGFYDRDSGELVVRSRDPATPLEPAEELILAHELIHALVDQRLGLPRVEASTGQEDAATAVAALIEGDATLVTQRYAQRALAVADQLRLAGQELRAGGDLAGTAALPYVVRRSLLLPYQEGVRFVAALLEHGGWAAVDAAYRDPPVSTAQVLFPQRYLDGEVPATPRPLGTLPAPWWRAAASALGAADLLVLFEAPGGEVSRALDDPLEAVAGWNGGALHLWNNEQDSAVGIVLVRRGDDELCGAVAAWTTASFPDLRRARRASGERLAVRGSGRAAVVACSDREVRVGVAPDLELARQLVAPP